MIAASLILFTVVWNAVGGWAGIESKLAATTPTLPARMLHVGGEHIETTDVRGSSEQDVMRQLLLGRRVRRTSSKSSRATRPPGWPA